MKRRKKNQKENSYFFFLKKENRRKFILFLKVNFPTHINAFKIFFMFLSEKHQLIYKKSVYITTDVASISILEMHIS